MKEGKIYVVAGKSRSGKTVFAQEIEKLFVRRMVWDIEDKYQGGERITTQAALVDAIKKGTDNIRFVGLRTDFDVFCQAAFMFGRLGEHIGKETLIIVEETSDVTHAGKAPANWGVLLRRGLKYGITIVAITQRIAESDKTAVGNASLIHCCKLAYLEDIATMAKIMRVEQSVIDNLVQDEDKGIFEFYQRDINRNETVSGVLTFPGGKAKFETKPIAKTG